MKINEIIFEDETVDDQLAANSKLLSVLMFLKKRSDGTETSGKLRTDSVIQLVQHAGEQAFGYDALVAAHEESDAVKGLIKSFNEREIILAADSSEENDEHTSREDSEGDPTANAPPSQAPAATVDSMAKSAMNKRV